MCQMHQYCKDPMFYICGDFNARCSDFQDFIAGFDIIPERHVIEFTANKYGDILCNFLIDSYCCMLNVRYSNLDYNDFTCIRSQGACVVDYCLVPHEDLDRYEDFKVWKVSDLINITGIFSTFDANTSNRTIRSWHGKLIQGICIFNSANAEYTRFDRVIPETFSESCSEELNHVIKSIECNIAGQGSLNAIYTEFVQVLLNKEMHQKLTPKM